MTNVDIGSEARESLTAILWDRDGVNLCMFRDPRT